MYMSTDSQSFDCVWLLTDSVGIYVSKCANCCNNSMQTIYKCVCVCVCVRKNERKKSDAVVWAPKYRREIERMRRAFSLKHEIQLEEYGIDR